MRPSSKLRHAYKALIELARTYESGKPVQIQTIASRHSLSQKFLLHVLLQLKGSGLIKSIRGAGGGYILGRDPKKITLGQIVNSIEGENIETAKRLREEISIADHSLNKIWSELTTIIANKLDQKSLAVIEKECRCENNFVYTI